VIATDIKEGSLKRQLFLLVPCVLCICATTVFADVFAGPLVIKNGHPLYAAIGSPSLLSAEPENSFDLNFSYASTYRIRGSKDWYYSLDLETAITDIQYKRLVRTGTEVGIDIPIIRYGPGFMDWSIETFHDFVGLHNAYGRNSSPRNQFLLRVVHDGKVIVEGAPGKTGLGDIKVEVKQNIYQNPASMVSLHAFMNMPTGDPDVGFGSGSPNGGLAMLMNEMVGADVKLYANAGIGLIDKLEAKETMTLRNYYYGGLGLEWRYSEKMVLNAQLFAQSSPFPKSDIFFIDDTSLLASVGGRYRKSPRSSIEFSFTEDPNTAGAPDVMFGADYRYTF
jgi:hypothetical protein